MYTTGKRKIGLYGGSFNPIHVGHITLAKRLMEVAGLDEVWMMVSPQNPFKANDTLLADDLRLAMTGTVRQFFAEHPDKFDPREYLKPARANIKEMVKHKLIHVLGCDGKA